LEFIAKKTDEAKAFYENFLQELKKAYIPERIQGKK